MKFNRRRQKEASVYHHVQRPDQMSDARQALELARLRASAPPTRVDMLLAERACEAHARLTGWSVEYDEEARPVYQFLDPAYREGFAR